jgi:hypothetical protein
MGRLQRVISAITKAGGYISGSYCRERIVRKDNNSTVHDVDVLITYKLLPELHKILIQDFDAVEDCYDNVPEESYYHGAYIISCNLEIDVFACEYYCYLCPPDVDVNTLCFTGKQIVSWFPSLTADIVNIVERCKRKEAIVLRSEWSSEDYGILENRLDKLRRKGWKLIDS